MKIIKEQIDSLTKEISTNAIQFNQTLLEEN